MNIQWHARIFDSFGMYDGKNVILYKVPYSGEFSLTKLTEWVAENEKIQHIKYYSDSEIVISLAYDRNGG